MKTAQDSCSGASCRCRDQTQFEDPKGQMGGQLLDTQKTISPLNYPSVNGFFFSRSPRPLATPCALAAPTPFKACSEGRDPRSRDENGREKGRPWGPRQWRPCAAKEGRNWRRCASTSSSCAGVG
jgi:hypothetical protein